jgi:hypothetical protein
MLQLQDGCQTHGALGVTYIRSLLLLCLLQSMSCSLQRASTSHAHAVMYLLPMSVRERQPP